MPRAPLVLALAFATTLALAIWFVTSDLSDRTTTAVAPSAEVNDKASAPLSDPQLTKRVEVANAPSPSSAPAIESDSPQTLEPLALTGLCVDATGAPVADVRIQVQVTPSQGDLGSGLALTTRSNADGRFSLSAGRAPFPCHMQMAFERAGHASLNATVSLFDSVAPPAGDLGAFPIVRGGEVTGLVSDASGQPVAGLALMLERKTDDGADAAWQALWEPRTLGDWGRCSLHKTPLYLRSVVTDQTGRFGSGVLLPGPWELSINSAKYDLVEPEELRFHSPQGADVLLRVHAREAIHGQVSSAFGAPGRLSVSVQAGAEERTVRTEDDGRFVVYRGKGEPAEVTLALAQGQPFDSPAAVPARWGQTVELTATPHPALVIRARTNQSLLTDFRVRLERAPNPGVFTSKGNEVRIQGLPLVPQTFYLDPGPGLGVAGPFVATPGPAPVVLDVPAPRLLDVTVLTADGEPALDATVQVVARRGPRQLTASQATELQPYDASVAHYLALSTSANPFPTSPLLWRSAAVDSRGRASIALPELDGWQVFIRAEAYREGVAFAPMPGGPGALTLRLIPGARITVNFQGPWPLNSFRPKLQRPAADARIWPTENGNDPQVRSFTFESVPAGRFELICLPPGSGAVSAGFVNSDGHTAQVLNVEASALAAEPHAVAVTLDNAPAPNGYVIIELRPQVKGRTTFKARSRVNVVDGTAQLPALPRGVFPVEFFAAQDEVHPAARGTLTLEAASALPLVLEAFSE